MSLVDTKHCTFVYTPTKFPNPVTWCLMGRQDHETHQIEPSHVKKWMQRFESPSSSMDAERRRLIHDLKLLVQTKRTWPDQEIVTFTGQSLGLYSLFNYHAVGTPMVAGDVATRNPLVKS